VAASLDKVSRWTFRALLVALLLCAPYLQSAPEFTVAGPSVAKAELERSVRVFRAEPPAALPLEKSFFTPAFFIKFDRQQNTRLWPFVFTGITRSPPLPRQSFSS
jgi:hypothetical protein